MLNYIFMFILNTYKIGCGIYIYLINYCGFFFRYDYCYTHLILYNLPKSI